jgi:hypothetical protein
VRRNPTVIAAYLGEEQDELAQDEVLPRHAGVMGEEGS